MQCECCLRRSLGGQLFQLSSGSTITSSKAIHYFDYGSYFERVLPTIFAQKYFEPQRNNMHARGDCEEKKNGVATKTNHKVKIPGSLSLGIMRKIVLLRMQWDLSN